MDNYTRTSGSAVVVYYRSDTVTHLAAGKFPHKHTLSIRPRPAGGTSEYGLQPNTGELTVVQPVAP
jgi:hypothetical protein